MTFQHVEAMLKPFQHLSTSGGSMVSVSKSVMAKVRALQAQAKDSIFSTAFDCQIPVSERPKLQENSVSEDLADLISRGVDLNLFGRC